MNILLTFLQPEEIYAHLLFKVLHVQKGYVSKNGSQNKVWRAQWPGAEVRPLERSDQLSGDILLKTNPQKENSTDLLCAVYLSPIINSQMSPAFYFYFIYFFFNFIFYFILLYNTVLVLPYIDMNPPRVYMHSLMTQQSHCWAYTLRKPELKETHVPQCSSQHCL